MTFEDELGPLLRQAGSAYELPTAAGADTVTSRYQRRHRRRTGLAGVAAALVLAVASFGVFKATAQSDSATVATVPETSIAVIDEDGVPADGALAEQAVPVAEEMPEMIPVETLTASIPESISTIVTVGDRYVGFSHAPVVMADGELSRSESRIVAVESTDGEEWVPGTSEPLPAELQYVQSVTEGDGSYLLRGGRAGFVPGGSSVMYLSTDMSTWTEVELPVPAAADGLITMVEIRDVAYGPAGFLAAVDIYEEVDPARFDAAGDDICSASGAKDSPDATTATYSIFPCGPEGEVETQVIEVDADFQPRTFDIRSSAGQIVLIGDGSAPQLVDAPANLASMTADESGYTAFLNDPAGATIGRSVDGRVWTIEPDAFRDFPTLFQQPYPGRIAAVGGRLLMLDWITNSTSVLASDDAGRTWELIEMPEVEGVENLRFQQVATNEYGVAFTAVDAADQPTGPGMTGFEFENDGYTFRTADGDPETFEVVDPDGAVVRAAPVTDVMGFGSGGLNSEIEGMTRDDAGRITVFDDAGEELVSFHPDQAMRSFSPIPSDPPDGSVAIEKDGYILEMEIGALSMIFTLFDGTEQIGTWNVDETTGSEPGLTFLPNQDLVFTDVETGEELVVITEAEGSAAFDAAIESGEFDLGGMESQTMYVIASRDGIDWAVAGTVEGFGTSLTIGDGEIVTISFGPTGSDISILPMPGG